MAAPERQAPPLGEDPTALLVIDMQRDFLDPGAPVETPGGLALVPGINRLARTARTAGVPVIFTHERHRADRSDFGIELEYEPAHCLEGTPGADLSPDLEMATGDFHITGKRRYDAFLGTDLDGLLRSLGIRALVVVGVCTDICVASTAQHARNLDYRVFVARDGVAGTSPERHEAALLCLSHVFARLTTLDEADAAFRAQAAARAA